MKKTKCLLVHTPRLTLKNGKQVSDINFMAMGLFSLAGELVKNNFDTKIIHLGVEKYLNKNFKLSSYVKENNIKMLSFSLHWNYPCYDVIETARIIKKECPGVFIVLGGYTASFFASEILEKFDFIDAIIKGEGELPIVSLANVLEENASLSSVENLYWRKNDQIVLNARIFVATSSDLDTYEFFNPDYMLHYSEYSKIPFVLDYSKENQLTNDITAHGVCLGRGCLGNCVWCSGGYNIQKTLSFRENISYRNIFNVISDIKTMKEKYSVKSFRFSFDPNPNDRNYLMNLFKEIAGEFNGQLDVIYNLDGLPDKDFLTMFKSAVSASSKLLLSPICHNEQIRKKYKSFFYTNCELEKILAYMCDMSVNTEIYFSVIPALDKNENDKTKEYGEYLKQKYSCVIDAYNYDFDIVPGSLWSLYPEKYNLKDIPKCFMDYYNKNMCVEMSFER